MKHYMSQETKSNCPKPEQTSTAYLVTGMIVLSCLSGVLAIWAVLATFRPKCLTTLKNKLILFFTSFRKTPVPPTPNLIELGSINESDPTPSLESAQQEPRKHLIRRHNTTFCPYKRSFDQIRSQIKFEAYSDLRRLLRQAKLDVQAEMEAKAKMEADHTASAPTFEEI